LNVTLPPVSDAQPSGGNTTFTRWFYLLAGLITLALLVGAASPLLSNLRDDELYFLQCAYGSVNFGTSISKCYVPATFSRIIAAYVSVFGMTGAVVAYKLSVLVLTAASLLWLFGGLRRAHGQFQTLAAFFVLATLLYYAASTRGVELRPEFFGIIGLFVGASPLIGRETLLTKGRLPLPVGLIVAQLALSVSALLSLRLVFPAITLGMGLIAVYLRVNHVRIISAEALRFLMWSALLAATTLLAIHVLFLDLVEQYVRITYWSPPPNHSSTWQRTFLDIGLYDQIRHMGWGSDIWRYQRLTLGVAAIGALAAVTCVRRDFREAPERALVGAALVVFWCLLTVEAKPFAYAVAIETALITLVWCACFNAISGRRAMNVFLSASVVLALLVAVQSTYSNMHVRNMTIARFAAGAITLNVEEMARSSNAELLRQFRHKHFLVQLAARAEFCRRHEQFVTLVTPFSRHPLCLRDAGSALLWDRTIGMDQLADIVKRHPNIIVSGVPEVAALPDLNLGKIGKGVYVKSPP
jgi:hypothetical protein